MNLAADYTQQLDQVSATVLAELDNGIANASNDIERDQLTQLKQAFQFRANFMRTQLPLMAERVAQSRNVLLNEAHRGRQHDLNMQDREFDHETGMQISDQEFRTDDREDRQAHDLTQIALNQTYEDFAREDRQAHELLLASNADAHEIYMAGYTAELAENAAASERNFILTMNSDATQAEKDAALLQFQHDAELLDKQHNHDRTMAVLRAELAEASSVGRGTGAPTPLDKVGWKETIDRLDNNPQMKAALEAMPGGYSALLMGPRQGFIETGDASGFIAAIQAAEQRAIEDPSLSDDDRAKILGTLRVYVQACSTRSTTKP